MDTKDIMVGDFVRYTEDQWETDDDKVPRTITGIGEPEYPDNMPFVKIDGSNERYHISLFEPIPLSEEILEKNGLVNCGDDIYQDDKYKWGVDFCKHEFYTFDEEIENQIKPILFFHQLQHALRLVGLNEVADNLKV